MPKISPNGNIAPYSNTTAMEEALGAQPTVNEIREAESLALSGDEFITEDEQALLDAAWQQHSTGLEGPTSPIPPGEKL
jgi:hypothetical protein